VLDEFDPEIRNEGEQVDDALSVFRVATYGGGWSLANRPPTSGVVIRGILAITRSGWDCSSRPPTLDRRRTAQRRLGKAHHGQA
jgi:hypothetical protein